MQSTETMRECTRGYLNDLSNLYIGPLSRCEIQKQTNETISMASVNLGQLTRIVRGETKQRRLQAEKLTSEFQLAVQKYSESQQKLVTKIRKTLLVQDFQNNEPESNGDSQLLQQQLQIHMDDARVREEQMREIEVHGRVVDRKTELTY